jgi:hypothetical protein
MLLCAIVELLGESSLTVKRKHARNLLTDIIGLCNSRRLPCRGKLGFDFRAGMAQ